MKYKYYIVDVFSRHAFGGNQLAVLPEAGGISPAGMQKIAREFNFAETTFVLPAKDSRNTCHVRIFSPKAELPFAGHPTVGTACALVMGEHYGAGVGRELVLEEGIGPVIVNVEQRHGALYGVLTLSGKVELPDGAPSKEALAAVLSVAPYQIEQVFLASVGLPFCFVQLASRDAVDRAEVHRAEWKTHLSGAWSPAVFFFAGDLVPDGEVYARMCAPGLGIEEDPATGSACAALVAAAGLRSRFDGDTFRLFIQQGVAMGRRSDIEAVARNANGALQSISVGGATAPVARGEIEVPPSCLLADVRPPSPEPPPPERMHTSLRRPH